MISTKLGLLLVPLMLLTFPGCKKEQGEGNPKVKATRASGAGEGDAEGLATWNQVVSADGSSIDAVDALDLTTQQLVVYLEADFDAEKAEGAGPALVPSCVQPFAAEEVLGTFVCSDGAQWVIEARHVKQVCGVSGVTVEASVTEVECSSGSASHYVYEPALSFVVTAR